MLFRSPTCGGIASDCILYDCNAWRDLHIGGSRPWVEGLDDMASRSRNFSPEDLCDFGLTCSRETSDCEVHECDAFLRNRRESTEIIQESRVSENLPQRSKAPSRYGRCDRGSSCGGTAPDCVNNDCNAWYELCWKGPGLLLLGHDDIASRSKEPSPEEFCGLGSTYGGETSDCKIHECNAFLRNRRESTETIRQSPASEDLPHRREAPSPDENRDFGLTYGGK